jgi:type II secretory pathway pseudopilin PulG
MRLRQRATDERGANALVVNIVGGIVGLIFIGAGVGSYLHMATSSTGQAATIAMRDLAAKVQNYYNTNGYYPTAANNRWDQTFFANTTYFPAQPVEPVCHCTGQYSLYVVPGATQFALLDDATQTDTAYMSTLNQSTLTTNGFVAGATCGSACHHLVFSSTAGPLGTP